MVSQLILYKVRFFLYFIIYSYKLASRFINSMYNKSSLKKKKKNPISFKNRFGNLCKNKYIYIILKIKGTYCCSKQPTCCCFENITKIVIFSKLKQSRLFNYFSGIQ